MFQFDASRDSGHRVLADSVLVQGEPLERDRKYRLCTKGYLIKGKDGYDCLMGARVIVNEDDGPQLSTIVQNHFKSVQIVSGERRPQFHHHQSIIAVSRRKSIARQVSVIEDPSAKVDVMDTVAEDTNGSGVDQVDAAFRKVTAKFARRRWHKAKFALAFTRRSTIHAVEKSEVQQAITPLVEHRIEAIGGELSA